MSNKFTVIKVLPKDGTSPSEEDLERWRQIFIKKEMTLQQAVDSSEVKVEVFDAQPDGEYCITLVRVGGEEYIPTLKDLQDWRDVFSEAQNDPDFKIFTHPNIEIEVIPVGKILAVE